MSGSPTFSRLTSYTQSLPITIRGKILAEFASPRVRRDEGASPKSEELAGLYLALFFSLLMYNACHAGAQGVADFRNISISPFVKSESLVRYSPSRHTPRAAPPYCVTRSFDFSYTLFLATSLRPSIVWNNVSDLTILDPSLTPLMVYTMLSQCPNLEHLSTDGQGCTASSAPALKTRPLLTLLHLSSLSVTFASACVARARRLSPKNITKTISHLFDRLVMPALKSLDIQASVLAIDYQLPTKLQQFIPSLEHLSLSRILFSPDDLYDLLSMARSLISLRLAAGSGQLHAYAETLLYLPYHPLEKENILPNLRSLAVDDNFISSPEAVEDWDFGVLHTIKSRFWRNRIYPHDQLGLARLTDVAIQWNRKGDRVVAKHFRLLQRSGLNVQYCVGYD